MADLLGESRDLRVVLRSLAFPKSARNKTGKEAILSLEKDPALSGGVLVKIGRVVDDGSLKVQMAKLKHDLYQE
jgi:F0F1-type ATP synthase delta subunit